MQQVEPEYPLQRCCTTDTLKSPEYQNNPKKHSQYIHVPIPSGDGAHFDTLNTQITIAKLLYTKMSSPTSASHAERNNPQPYFSSDRLASTILFPAIPVTFSSSPPLSSKASISSPPPILLPLTSMFGTVRLPVLFPNAACNPGPKGWLSSSTTYGAGTMVYFSSSMRLAFAE